MAAKRKRSAVHAANNELIAITKREAERLGVSFVLACGGLADEGQGQFVCGVDSNDAGLELHLAAMAHGACVEREELRRQQRSEDAMILGMQAQRSLFDRDGVFDVNDERLDDEDKDGG